MAWLISHLAKTNPFSEHARWFSSVPLDHAACSYILYLYLHFRKKLIDMKNKLESGYGDQDLHLFCIIIFNLCYAFCLIKLESLLTFYHYPMFKSVFPRYCNPGLTRYFRWGLPQLYTLFYVGLTWYFTWNVDSILPEISGVSRFFTRRLPGIFAGVYRICHHLEDSGN